MIARSLVRRGLYRDSRLRMWGLSLCVLSVLANYPLLAIVLVYDRGVQAYLALLVAG